MIYKAPGIYVEEIPSGPRPVSGVSTSVLGLVGVFDRGPNVPVFVSSYAEFERKFGYPGYSFYKDTASVRKSAYGVKAFFENGGSSAWILRINGGNKASADVNTDKWKIYASSGGSWGNAVSVVIEAGSYGSDYKNLTVKIGNNAVEFFDNVNFADPSNPRYVTTIVNQGSEYIYFEVGTGGGGVPTDGTISLAGGTDSAVPSSVSIDDFRKFDFIDDILLLVVPAFEGDTTTLLNLKSYLETNKWRFGIVSIDHSDPNTVPSGYDSVRSSYIAFYLPYVFVKNPDTGEFEKVSPSGHVAGYYARNDVMANVGKTPAGVSLGSLNGIIGLALNYTQANIELLYPKNFNPIISKPGYGIVIFGGRLSTLDPQWIYINKRRLLQFVEKSIKDAIAWVNFENNNTITRLKVKDQIESFLTRLFTLGYFAGNSKNEAFFVICDDSNNPPDSVSAGYLYVDVGIAVNKPAEFVVLRFQEKTQG